MMMYYTVGYHPQKRGALPFPETFPSLRAIGGTVEKKLPHRGEGCRHLPRFKWKLAGSSSPWNACLAVPAFL